MKRIILLLLAAITLLNNLNAEIKNNKKTFSNEYPVITKATAFTAFIIGSGAALKFLSKEIKRLVLDSTREFREHLNRDKEKLEQHLAKLVNDFAKQALAFKNELNLSSDIPTCYDVLGLPDTATKEAITKSYRTLSNKYHPDKSEIKPIERTTELFKLIVEAKDLAMQDLAHRNKPNSSNHKNKSENPKNKPNKTVLQLN